MELRESYPVLLMAESLPFFPPIRAPGLQAAAAAKFDETLKLKENKLNKELKEILENLISANLVPFNEKDLCHN